jgi:2,4-dienoyl-CoA reductase-like NADH-dependent reductase (Old Yellow Enzyme family)
MRPEIVPELAALTDAIHDEGGLASAQLGHSGDFADKGVIGGRPMGPSTRFNLYGLALAREMTRTDMDDVRDQFAAAAVLACEAGFDAVEVHVGHGYLLSQFLSPWTNKRRDAWGGDLDARLEFPLEVVAAVREAMPPDRAVIAKMNLEDGFDGGLMVDDAVRVALALEGTGVDALVPSGGFVSRAPLYMMRGAVPTAEMAAVQTSWLRRVGLRLFGRWFVPEYPYDDLFFLTDARRLVSEVQIPVVLVGGVRSRAQMDAVIDEGFGFVALGRPLLREPDLVASMMRDDWHESACVPCNECIVEMDKGGVRCPRRPAAQPMHSS